MLKLMSLYLHVFFSICFAVALFVYYENISAIRKLSSFSEPLLLVVGILSARDNFKLREAVRSTWLKEYLPHQNAAVKAWFIIGKDDCQIPPDYRLSKYECSKWNINKSGLTDNFYTLHEIYTEECLPNSKNVFRQGFSFKVNHPVIVKRLGVLLHLLIPNVETKVAILDIQSKEIVVQSSINRNSSYLENGYLYEDTEAVLLPKHYEGMVLVEGYLQHEACSYVDWNDGGGIITFNRIYLTPSHIDSVKFTKEAFSAVSIQFLVHDMKGLEAMKMQEDAVTSDWIANLTSINQDLLAENMEKEDILFVNVTDTYRNLPSKLLKFYEWINNNYKFLYFLKSDDDTIIDISYLIQNLQNHSRFKSDDNWIWSRFRKDWPVNYIGKWADYDYRSSFYPSFPCGAAYVMPHKTVRWLSSNANYLFPYQGEDVSMGIWLSAIRPDFIDDEHFECDSTCRGRSYNRAQLTENQIYEVWSQHEKCKNLCSCD